MADFDETYEWLEGRFPTRARPVGFYPLPDTKAEVSFDPAWIGQASAAARNLLYIHVPFCNQRCGYCRFYPGPASRGIEEQFLGGAISQLQWWAQTLDSSKSPEIHAVFFGGGSPSALTAPALRTLMDAIRSHFDVRADCEITMEWYPADSSPGKIQAAWEMGVSRISIGAQSWNPNTLKALGCHHTPDSIDQLLGVLDSQEIGNVNIDLMSNVPGQTLDDHLADIQRASDRGAAMVSTNILESAAGTPFSVLGGEEDSDPMKRLWLRQISRRLRELGFTAQRTRNFYRNGRRLHQYNRSCTGLDFNIVPIGPGAYGYVAGMPVISNPDRNGWLETCRNGAISGYSRASEAEKRRAFIANSLLELTLHAGAYADQFNANAFEDFPVLAELTKQSLLLPDGDIWRLSHAAIEFADDIIVSVFSTAQRELFDRHLQIGRSRTASQYFPVLPNPTTANGAPQS